MWGYRVYTIIVRKEWVVVMWAVWRPEGHEVEERCDSANEKC